MIGTDVDLEDRYRELRDNLLRAVNRVCPPWLASRRDDLVQAAVLRVMDVERRSEGARELELKKAYLYRVAHSALIDEIRRHRRRGEVPIEGEVHSQPSPDAGSVSPERTAVSADIGRAIQESLLEIKRERRLAVTLYLQGHSVPESAAILGWTRKKTENLVYRGLADLRQWLLERGITP